MMHDFGCKYEYLIGMPGVHKKTAGCAGGFA